MKSSKSNGKIIRQGTMADNMNRQSSVMGGLMVASAVSVSAGATILRIYSLVPFPLTYATIAALLILAVTAYYVFKGSGKAMNFALVLSVPAIISSLSSPSHLSAMADIYKGGIIALLDVLEILGFYLFPAIYIIMWAKDRRKPVTGTAD